MSDLVRVRVGGVEKNVGAAFAERFELEVLDEPTHRPDGTTRGETRAGGRARKPKTSVAEAATKKAAKAAESESSGDAESE